MSDVLILTTTSGHESIAEAVSEDFIEAGYSTHIHLEEEALSFAVYRQFYRRFPDKFDSVYQLANSRVGQQSSYWQLILKNSESLLQAVEDSQPRLIVSTAFSFNPVLEFHRRNLPPYLCILPNPRNYFHHDVNKGAACNLAFDEQTRQEALERHPKAAVRATGWFVRERFETTYSQKSAQHEKHIASDRPCFLLTGGSQGAKETTDIARRLILNAQEAKLPLSLVVVAGNNEALRQKIQTFAADRDIDASPHLSLDITGFVDDMEHYMQAADLVVGKAGPNTIFEAVATETPFLAITHIGGLEDRNLDLIQEYNIGWVNEDSVSAAEQLTSLAQDIGSFQSFKHPLAKLRHFNATAARDLLEIAEPLLERSLD